MPSAQGLFTYDGLDVFNDFLLSHDEAVKRGGGVIKLASGSLGVVGGLGTVSAGAAGCAPSAGTTCLLIPVGGALVAVSYEEAKDGTGQALGSYRSTEGSQVLASFDAATYPGERNRAAELGVDAATATALTVAGKLGGSYLEKTWSQLKGWVSGVVGREVVEQTAYKTIKLADSGIRWGKGIQGQGLPWEDYLQQTMPAGSRLPPGTRTFDFFDESTLTAVSAKTLDTTTAAKVANPSQVYSSLKRNVDDVVNFKEAKVGDGKITSDMISAREVHVAIPEGTTSAQWDQINRAVQYGKDVGVNVRITVVKP